MIVVIFVLMILYGIQYPNPQYRLTHKIPWIYAIIAMGYIVFWAAMRTGYMDTANYILSFDRSSIGFAAAIEKLRDTGKGPGWNFLMIIYKTYVSDNPLSWLGFVAIATGLPIMITLRERSINFLYSMLLFVGGLTFLWMFNGIRQFLAAAIMFGCSGFIFRRKVILFLVFLLIAASIHSTALLLLPAYFIVKGRPFGWKIICFAIAISIASIFIGEVMDTMEIFMQDTVYAENFEQFEEDDGVHPLRVLMEAIPVFLAFIKRDELKKLNNNAINICINMSTIALGIYFIGIFTSGVMIGRLPIYFSMFNLILLPYLFEKCFIKIKNGIYIGYTLFIITFYFALTTATNTYYISETLGIYPSNIW